VQGRRLVAELRSIRSIEPLVTREELAELLNVSTDSVDEMRRAGMPWIRWGSRLVRFEATAAVAWLKAHGSEAA
jgi:phage terminase Nu1 subunit (DNA packaging protein)